MKRLSDDPAVRLADCRGESVTPAGEAEVMRVVTDKQCPIVRKNVGSALDLHAGPNCMHCEGTGFVVKYVDRAHVTPLTAERDQLVADCWKACGGNGPSNREDLLTALRLMNEAEDELTAERDGLLAEVERLRKVTNFEDAVACVFDNLKFAAANTGSKEWDDQLEDLAEEVIEYAPKYKKQWKDICSLQSELTKARGLLGQWVAIAHGMAKGEMEADLMLRSERFYAHQSAPAAKDGSNE